jgi:predicted nucleic acid-binding protein
VGQKYLIDSNVLIDISDKMERMENFVGLAQVIPLDEKITIRTIDLRRKYKKLKLGDAIIAATAMEHSLTVMTRNIDDFKNIAGLQLLNPHLI